MTSTTASAGTMRLADDLVLSRIGYGAIQLAGPMAWGPPRDRDAAGRVLRAVVDLGITHIDTSDYYGPHTVNELIRETLHPYPAGLRIVTKVGARRGPDKSWPAALSRDELVRAVHDNLEHLGLETLDLVNLRMTDSREPSLEIWCSGALAQSRIADVRIAVPAASASHHVIHGTIDPAIRSTGATPWVTPWAMLGATS